jgi:polyhydroxyalkanoate synthesis regulator phasin
MDTQALALENDIPNYNKVKDLVVQKMIEEGYISREEGEEFVERCQVLIYKGNWFSRWFDKNKKSEMNSKDNYYIRIIEMKEKQTSLDDLIRRTANGK